MMYKGQETEIRVDAGIKYWLSTGKGIMSMMSVIPMPFNCYST